jgi:hypothetical protein
MFFSTILTFLIAGDVRGDRSCAPAAAGYGAAGGVAACCHP